MKKKSVKAFKDLDKLFNKTSSPTTQQGNTKTLHYSKPLQPSLKEDSKLIIIGTPQTGRTKHNKPNPSSNPKTRKENI